MIGIVSYGCGNIASLVNMVKKSGGDCFICDHPRSVEKAHKLILPGVGAFDYAMSQLDRNGWLEPLDRAVKKDNKLLLGICLGMQLLCKSSEEGEKQGLGWIDATVKKFNFDSDRKIPHMGWGEVEIKKKNKLLFKSERQRFYFVHSYYVDCKNQEDVMVTAHYGRDFVAGVASNNVYGLQFHPEKSHRFGMGVMKNFLEM